MKFIRNAIFRIRFRIDESLSSFSDIVKQIIIWVSTITSLFWLSVFVYGTFFFYYVPIVTQEKPVYFQFRACEDGISRCSYPSANISLAKEGQTEIFKIGQLYKLMLDIDMPESEVNRKLGMFMIEMKLYNKKGETVQTAAKPTTLNYKSDLLQVLDTLVFSPFYLLGYMHQKQGLHVEMFSEYKDNTYNPCIGTVISINNLKVEVYSATLKVFAQFSGIRYFLYYWPVTAAIVGISWNFVILLFIAAISWYAFLLEKTPSHDGCREVVKIELPKNRKPEGSPRKSRKALRDPLSIAETIGRPGYDDETSLLTPVDTPADSSTDIRQRQPYTTAT